MIKAFFLYLLISLFLLKAYLIRSSVFILGYGIDANQFINYMGWISHALYYKLNPFIDTSLYTGHVNFAVSTSVFLFSILFAVVSHVYGSWLSYNIIIVLCMPLSALSMFYLSKYLGGRYWINFLAGFIYGFSIFQYKAIFCSDINVAFIVFFPLILYYFIRFYRKEIGWKKYVLFNSLILTFQMYIFSEYYVSICVISFLSLAIYFIIYRNIDVVKKYLYFVLSYFISLILSIPYLYYFFIYKGINVSSYIGLYEYSAGNIFLTTLSIPFIILLLFLDVSPKLKKYFLLTGFLFLLFTSFHILFFVPVFRYALPYRFINFFNLLVAVMVVFYSNQKVNYNKIVYVLFLLIILKFFYIMFFSRDVNVYNFNKKNVYSKLNGNVLIVGADKFNNSLFYQSYYRYKFNLKVGYFWHVNMFVNYFYHTKNINYLGRYNFFYFPRSYNRKFVGGCLYPVNHKFFNISYCRIHLFKFIRKYNVNYLVVGYFNNGLKKYVVSKIN